MVSVTAVDLHAFIDHVVKSFGRVDLHDGTLGCELLDGLHHAAGGIRLIPGEIRQMGFDQAAGSPRYGFRRVNADGHFGQLVLNDAEIRDGRAERLALFRIRERDLKHVLHAADRERAELQASQVQDVERDDVAAADLAQQVFFRDVDVIEENGRGGASLDAHLLFFGSGGYAGEIALDEKG